MNRLLVPAKSNALRAITIQKPLPSAVVPCADKKVEEFLQNQVSKHVSRQVHKSVYFSSSNPSPTDVNTDKFKFEFEFSINKKEADDKEKREGPGGPPPKFNHLKEIERLLKKHQTTSVFPNSLGKLPQKLEDYIADDVKVEVNLHLRDYYEKMDMVKNMGNTLNEHMMDRLRRDFKEKNEGKKDEEDLDKDFDERKRRAEKIAARIIMSLDPTGTYESLFSKSGHYKNLKINGKEKSLLEFQKACRFVQVNHPMGTLECENIHSDEEAMEVSSKLRWINIDPVFPQNFRVYTYVTVSNKKITKVKITDVEKSKSAADKAKDALKSLGSMAAAPPAGK